MKRIKCTKNCGIKRDLKKEEKIAAYYSKQANKIYDVILCGDLDHKISMSIPIIGHTIVVPRLKSQTSLPSLSELFSFPIIETEKYEVKSVTIIVEVKKVK
jgi:hypothetical protein